MPEGKKFLKPIPPTLRGKKRYVKFRFLCGEKLGERDVHDSVWSSFGSLFGQRGIAEQRLWLVKWFGGKNEGILRCSLSEEENVKAGLLFVQKTGNAPVIPMILKVSGSISKLK